MSVCFLKRGGKDADSYLRGDREDPWGVRGGETIIWKYCLKKPILIKTKIVMSYQVYFV